MSSSGIVAKLLGDLDRLGNRETPTVLSILVLEDLSMALYLPVVTALLAASGVVAGVRGVLVAVAVLVAVLLAAVRFGDRLSHLVFSPDNEVLLLRILGLALLVAGLAEQLRVSAAVGAFLVGIAMSGKLAEEAQRLLGPLRDLFAAVFFVFFGLQTDPGSMLPALPPAIALAAAGVLTKLATGWIAARRAGIAARGRVRAGAILVPRGEFSIVIAGLAGGLEPRLGPLAATYVMIMGVVGPLAPRLLDPVARWAGRRESQRRAAERAAAQPSSH